MTINYNFAAFILTHGRAGSIKTDDSLVKAGYTGKIFYIVDNEDKQREQYVKLYGDKVVIFNKKKAAAITDAGDNTQKLNSVVYARNQCFEIARKLNLDYFLQLDDDYGTFRYAINDKGRYITSETKTNRIDDFINHSLEFLINSKFNCVAWAQGGDFIGGEGSGLIKRYYKNKLLRKVMNSFFCDTARPFNFIGRMNDDVNTYVTKGMRGMLFCTIANARLEQAETQSLPGGLTEMYLEAGTYVKSFYTVMMAPSCTKICEMGNVNKRLHHKIDWKKCSPVILDEKHRKVII